MNIEQINTLNSNLQTSKPSQMNEQMKNWLNAYGVFCVAMSLPDRDEKELDLLWEQACGLYQDFLTSPFNNPGKSELDCVQEFIREWNNREDGIILH